MSISVWDQGGHHEAWDDFLQEREGAHYWQLHGWLSSYEPLGLESGVITKTDEGGILGGAGFVSYRLPLSMGRIFIVPHGPVCSDPDSGVFEELMDALVDYCRSRRAIYIQTWPHAQAADTATLDRYVRAGFTGPRLFRSHGFSSIVLAIDIGRQSEQEVLAAMKRKKRKYCRLALTSGLELCTGESYEFLEQCHQVWKEAFAVHGAEVRPLSTYRVVLERLVRKGKGLLLQARKDDELVGALCVVFVGGSAVPIGAGMRRAFSKLFPSEFLHMSAMRLARERGLQTYDLNNWGPDSLAQYKRGFRPVERTWAKPCSMVLRPMTTRLVVGVEKYGSKGIRRFLRNRASRE
jgi:lipid II:glycine glycyltransferase (peptidoglycan interpeptide bridge formation enzyme)